MTTTNTEQSRNDLALLAEISELFALNDPEWVLHKVVQLAIHAVSAADASLIMQRGETGETLYIGQEKLSDAYATTLAETLLESGLAGWVMRERQSALVKDTYADPRWYRLDNKPDTGSALALPVIYQETLLAVLTLIHPKVGYFTPAHLDLMKIIANQSAVAIHNADLYKRLQTQQQRMEIIVNAIPDAIMVLNATGDILSINQAALHLLDYTQAAQVIGQSLADLLRDDENLNIIAEIIDQTLDTAPKERSNVSFETRSQRHKNDYHVTMTIWEETHKSGYIVLLHDVTTLRDLYRFKDEILRLASHDLRSPLSLIVGYADMITLDTPDPTSPVHDHVEVIQRSTEHMDTLLEELLRVEQIRSSPLELREEVNAEQLVRVVLVNTRPDAQKRQVTLSANINLDDMPRMVVDRALIRQAMENLVSNALKYTATGGLVMIDADYANGHFNFVVEDNGIGIANESLPYVFEAFYRARQTGTEAIEGSGLGLSLVKDVVERHGGKVWVTSNPGEGSRFGFRIPVHTPK